MPDPIETTDPADPAPVPAKPAPEPKPTDPQEHMIPKSRLDDEIQKRKDAETQLQALQQADEQRKRDELTESERLKLEKQEAEKERDQLKLEKQQRSAADKVGLPAEFADRLKGNTPAEMEADALKLLEAMPKQEKKKQEKINNTTPTGTAKDAAEMTDQEKSAFLWGK